MKKSYKSVFWTTFNRTQIQRKHDIFNPWQQRLVSTVREYNFSLWHTVTLDHRSQHLPYLFNDFFHPRFFFHCLDTMLHENSHLTVCYRIPQFLAWRALSIIGNEVNVSKMRKNRIHLQMIANNNSCIYAYRVHFYTLIIVSAPVIAMRIG